MLDFSSAFDTIDHTILVHRHHTDIGFTDTVLQWFSSYLTDRTQYVSLSNHCSAFAPVHSGVPRGSVLGPILFTMYTKPLSAIIDSHYIIHHSFADDLQLQMSAPPDRISELLHSMQSCISDVKAWATANMLKLNDSKTELMLVTSKRSKHLHNLPTSITIGNAQIPFKQSVKNLCFTLDCHLTMNAHVSNIPRTCYLELRRLCYHCCSSTAPSYVAVMQQKKPSHTRKTRSSSYTMPLLNRPTHSKATLDDCLFSFASSVWNSTSNDVRCAPSLSSSKSRLKPYLFRSIYKDITFSLIAVHMCMVWPCHSFVDGLS